jgi:hypothetical protein
MAGVGRGAGGIRVIDGQEGVEANKQVGMVLEELVNPQHEIVNVHSLILERVHDVQKGTVDLGLAEEPLLDLFQIVDSPLENARGCLRLDVVTVIDVLL